MTKEELERSRTVMKIALWKIAFYSNDEDSRRIALKALRRQWDVLVEDTLSSLSL